MVIEISEKFDDLGLSPEAYRLYMHLRRLALEGTDEINKPLTDILNHCQIPYSCSDLSVGKFFMELNNRKLLDFEINWWVAKGTALNGIDIVLTRVTFLPVEEWV
jgi:hypothetical protein